MLHVTRREVWTRAASKLDVLHVRGRLGLAAAGGGRVFDLGLVAIVASGGAGTAASCVAGAWRMRRDHRLYLLLALAKAVLQLNGEKSVSADKQYAIN